MPAEIVLFPQGGARRGEDVKPLNPFAVYEAAKALRELANFQADVAPGQVLFALWRAEQAIDRLIAGEIVPLDLCRGNAEAVKRQIDQIRLRYFTTVKQDGAREFRYPADNDPPIPGWEFALYRQVLDAFETVFAAEMDRATTYYVAKRGIYTMRELVESAEARISEDLRKQMNDTSVKDFHDAGRCLAFNLPTSAGLHAARAVEGVLGDYYRLFVGPNGKHANKGTMNDYISELSELKQSVVGGLPDKKTLRILNEIKNLDRNPLMHPRETLDIDEAENLFDLATAAIRSMLKEMAHYKTEGQPKLPLKVMPGRAEPKTA